MFDPDELDAEAAAYHEAGHAFLAIRLGGEVRAVAIENEDGDREGRTTVAWHRLPVAERRQRSALVALAGPVAEAMWQQDVDRLHQLSAWRADWREVQAALAASAPPAEQPALLQRWLRRVRSELDDPEHWERVCRLADALSAHGVLDADMVAEAIAD